MYSNSISPFLLYCNRTLLIRTLGNIRFRAFQPQYPTGAYCRPYPTAHARGLHYIMNFLCAGPL